MIDALLSSVPSDLQSRAEVRARLLGSFLTFIQFFYKELNGREFALSYPVGRESHYITIARELHKVFHLETNRLIINIPPGHGKSTMLVYFMAWAMAHYPDCQFMYISYSHDLASKHTFTCKQIMDLPSYKQIFGVGIRRDSSAKDKFMTTEGGSVTAFGSLGSITGQDAGLPNVERFSGCVLMDDLHKPDEVHSDTIRESVIRNYNETIKQRPRSDNVPLISIGQRLHEGDHSAFLLDGKDGYAWQAIILASLDVHENALAPNIKSKEALLIEQEFNSYTFYAQHQQNPLPAGGALFKKDQFYLLNEEPNVIATFITCDTAETDKDYNDASVFSFWGIYKIDDTGLEQPVYALHWISCTQVRIEPKDLKDEFLYFYNQCLLYKSPPRFAVIEKKSTGVTLVSVLSAIRGLDIRYVHRTKASGCKTARYNEIQPYIARKLVSLPGRGEHSKMCIDHCSKITANNSHAHDDIADTLYDAIKIALIDKLLINMIDDRQNTNKTVESLANRMNNLAKLHRKANQTGSRPW